jgi:phosphate:Na+ symporter
MAHFVYRADVMISSILGGIGLFLLGMVLMTEGLKAAAGDTLRRVLSRFTGGRVQAFLSGAAATALVQSSSATILTTIGFVSAGLLTFPQALGVIFGAATGTTTTGWIVSLVGLRFGISAVALPLIGVGALMRLLGSGRSATLGMALAGFGLIFVGIDTLQGGMQALSARIDPATFPGTTLAGRLLLVGVGMAMTVVMQSSSAAVATTLAALDAGTIRLEQAALLVVGQNMGTAVTAALASIGAVVAAKRTALAHVLFNAFAGVAGLLLLPLFLAAVGWLATQGRAPEAAVAIAFFHTGFNLVAVAVLLPALGSFAALVTRLLPDRGPTLTRYLDPSVAEVGPVAVEAARRTTVEVGAVVVEVARGLLREEEAAAVRERLDVADRALSDTRRFLGTVRTSRAAPAEHARHLAVLHALDHWDRMVEALREPEPLRVIRHDAELRGFAEALAERLALSADWLAGEGGAMPLEEIRRLAHDMAETRRGHRPLLMARTADGELDPDTALRRLDAMRWLDRVAYHTWRATEHLAEETAQPAGGATAAAGAGELA